MTKGWLVSTHGARCAPALALFALGFGIVACRSSGAYAAGEGFLDSARAVNLAGLAVRQVVPAETILVVKS